MTPSAIAARRRRAAKKQGAGASKQNVGASKQSGGASKQSGGASKQSGGASKQSGGASKQNAGVGMSVDFWMMSEVDQAVLCESVFQIYDAVGLATLQGYQSFKVKDAVPVNPACVDALQFYGYGSPPNAAVDALFTDIAEKHVFTEWEWRDNDDVYHPTDDADSWRYSSDAMDAMNASFVKGESVDVSVNNGTVRMVPVNVDECMQAGNRWYRHVRRVGSRVSRANVDNNVLSGSTDKERDIQAKQRMFLTKNLSPAKSSAAASSAAASGAATKVAVVPQSYPPDGSSKYVLYCDTSEVPHGEVPYMFVASTIRNIGGTYVYIGNFKDYPMWQNGTAYIVRFKSKYVVAEGGIVYYTCTKGTQDVNIVAPAGPWTRGDHPSLVDLPPVIIIRPSHIGGRLTECDQVVFQCSSNPTDHVPIWRDFVDQTTLWAAFHKYKDAQTTVDNLTIAGVKVNFRNFGNRVRFTCRNACIPRRISASQNRKRAEFQQWATTGNNWLGGLTGEWEWQVPYEMRTGHCYPTWLDDDSDHSFWNANAADATEEFHSPRGKRRTFVGFFRPEKTYYGSRSPKDALQNVVLVSKSDKVSSGRADIGMSVLYHGCPDLGAIETIVRGHFAVMGSQHGALYGYGVYQAIHPYVNYTFQATPTSRASSGYAQGVGPRSNYLVVIVSHGRARPSLHTSSNAFLLTKQDRARFYTGGNIHDPVNGPIKELPLPLEDGREVVFFGDALDKMCIIGVAVFVV